MRNSELGQDAKRLKEFFFSRGMEILRPALLMINDTYPLTKRDRLSPNYDPVVLEEYEKANKRARFVLYEQRNVVQDKWLPRYDVTYVSKPHHTEDWDELKGLMVDGCLDRVSELLIALSPIIMAKQYVEGAQQAILRVTDIEKQKMADYLRSFYVVRRPGIPTLEADYL